ncbi:MAG: helix-turn-helix domain-containing protein [Candidatus Symbiothrix sp.]|nr:helix-turn-helix domain-containing protein [Candidatus Symbiothrix sp.]
MKQKTIFIQVNPNELVGQFKTEMRELLKSELLVVTKSKGKQPMQLLTIKEVCELLRCSVSSVRRLMDKNVLIAYKSGKRLLFKSEEVEATLIQLNTKNYGY